MTFKKAIGGVLATSPIWLLVGVFAYAEGWKAGLFVVGGTFVMLAVVFSGILLLAD